MDVVVTRSLAGLDRLREDWTELLSRCSHATIFQTWEWNRTWWEIFGREGRLFLVQVREDDQLVGLAPLYVTRTLGFRKLAFVGSGITDYMDVIAPADRAPEVWRSVLLHTVGAPACDLLELQNLCLPAPMLEAVEVTSREGSESVRWSRCDAEAGYSVPLPSTWEEYLGRLDKIVKSNLLRRSRNLEKTFKQVETRLSNELDLPEVMNALFELHERRWNTRQMPGNLNTEKVREFHRRISRQFYQRGWLRLHYLRLEGRIAAVQYSFRFRKRSYGYLNGFEPELRRFSLGSSLLAAAIQYAISEGCNEFDLMRGDEAYKSQWLTERLENSRIVVMRNNVRSQIASWLGRMAQTSRSALSRTKFTIRQFVEARTGDPR